MSACYQFRVDGRAAGSPARTTWAEAAQDAVNAGYAIWQGRNSIKIDLTAGGEIAQWRRYPATRAALSALEEGGHDTVTSDA
ncbi:MAG: hypothetical protein K0S00_4462 [Xanthobacteraceae bacterium]|jgi:hypothetical protein|nr:hypothetical protein [Xanthobacteraceae bacterium]